MRIAVGRISIKVFVQDYASASVGSRTEIHSSISDEAIK